MLEIVTTSLEILGLVLIIAGVGVVTTSMVGGQFGAGIGLAAAGISALVASAVIQWLDRPPRQRQRR